MAWKLTHSTQVSTIASILKMLLAYYTIKVHPRSNIIVAIHVIKVNVWTVTNQRGGSFDLNLSFMWIMLACKNVFCLTLRISVNHDYYVQVLFYLKYRKACKNRTSRHTKFDCFFKLCSPIKVYPLQYGYDYLFRD